MQAKQLSCVRHVVHILNVCLFEIDITKSNLLVCNMYVNCIIDLK